MKVFECEGVLRFYFRGGAVELRDCFSLGCFYRVYSVSGRSGRVRGGGYLVILVV